MAMIPDPVLTHSPERGSLRSPFFANARARQPLFVLHFAYFFNTYESAADGNADKGCEDHNG